MSNNPWDEDYIPPPPAPPRPKMTKQEAGSKGAKKTRERRKRHKAENPDANPWEPIPDSKMSKRLAKVTEAHVNPRMRLEYDQFVTEYLYDFSAEKAWLRCNRPLNQVKRAYEWLRTSYVQQRIREVIELLDEENIMTRKEILIGIKREMHAHGLDANSASRTAALKLAAQLRGMLVKKTESKVQHQGGVMIVPMPASQVDWENSAQQSQAALKHEVRK